MNPPETNDPLDALLKENDPYMDDNGFTARVMATLPRRHGLSLRQWILLAAVLAGCAGFVWLMPSFGEFISVGPSGSYSLSGEWWWIVVAVLGAVASVCWGLFSAAQSDD